MYVVPLGIIRYATLSFLALLCVETCWAEPPTACSDQIRYLSATDSAYKYLETRQREIYEANPGLVDPFSRAQLNKPGATTTLSELSDKLAKQGCDAQGKNCVGNAALYKRMDQELRCKGLPTRFESPMFIGLIDLYTQALEVVRQRDYPMAQVARFGSLPTGTIDAQAMLPPMIDRPIVILNRDTFFFTGAFSKSISDAIPISEENGKVVMGYSPEAIAQRLKDHPYIVHNFADAMSRMVRGGSSKGAEEVILDADHNRLHARLVTAMDMFIISHEEAHVILRHVDKDSRSFSFQSVAPLAAGQGAASPSGDTAIIVQIRTREQEYEADALGYQLMVKATVAERDPIKLMIAAAAPHMVFRLIDAADAYGRAANGHSFSDPNHPSAADRIKSLNLVYKRLSGPGEPLDRLPDFRPVFDASLEALLKSADPLIRQNLGLPAALQ